MKPNGDNNGLGIGAPSSKSSDDIRLVVLDIDGTLVDESNRVSDTVARAIDSVQSSGVAVALATGRMLRSALPIYQTLNSTVPLVCYEGALIRQPQTGLIHRQWPVEPQAASNLLDLLDRLKLNGQVSIHFYVEDDLYVSNLTDATIRYLGGSGLEPIVVADLRQLLDLTITKLIVLSEDQQLITELCGQLQNSISRAELRRYHAAACVEVFHAAANKRLAVSYLAEEIMSYRAENVLAIGDDYTDIEMLRYAGIGVAMGNAPPAVKAAADWVTTSVAEDGVAKAIERVFNLPRS